MGSLHSLHKFSPNLAEISASLRPLLSQNNEFIWTNQCETAFDSLKRLVASIIELKLFDIHRETLFLIDASHDGSGAMIEQYSQEGWQSMSFAFRHLNPAERKYSTNELELLAVVWAIEHYRNCIYGLFYRISGHKALLTLLKSSLKGNKTFFSRITRWYNSLLPFDFKQKHRKGSKMGMVDYFSRYLSSIAPPTSHYDSTFLVAETNMINKAVNPPRKIRKM